MLLIGQCMYHLYRVKLLVLLYFNSVLSVATKFQMKFDYVVGECTVATNQPYLTVLYYGKVWYSKVQYYRGYLYKLFTKSDVMNIYLKKYVIGFGVYTPPLPSYIHRGLPHPIAIIVITGATGLLTIYIT